jgi:hypothetical protein
MGSLTRIAVPACGRLSMWIVPPIASTRSTRPVSPDPLDATGALLGALLPALGVAVIVAFNAYYWLPIRGESPRPQT